MKTVTVGDIHGKDVWKQIDPKKYDKIIFVGDYVDDFPPTTDEQILTNLLNIIEFKKSFPLKVELLWGNHDLQYIQKAPICSGYRPSMSASLSAVFSENQKLFKHAFQIENYIWTHAGILQPWLEKEFKDALANLFAKGIDFSEYSLADQINFVSETSESFSLLTISRQRGGWSRYGGPLWADKSEFNFLGDHNLPKGYNQIVGHSKVKDPYENWYNILGKDNTSITFVDCLDTVTKFYEKEI